jgi:hypothetical protein
MLGKRATGEKKIIEASLFHILVPIATFSSSTGLGAMMEVEQGRQKGWKRQQSFLHPNE